MNRRVGVSKRQLTAEAYALTAEGREMVDCPTCDGFGEVETSSFLEHGGPDETFATCGRCMGDGRVARWELL